MVDAKKGHWLFGPIILIMSLVVVYRTTGQIRAGHGGWYVTRSCRLQHYMYKNNNIQLKRMFVSREIERNWAEEFKYL